MSKGICTAGDVATSSINDVATKRTPKKSKSTLTKRELQVADLAVQLMESPAPEDKDRAYVARELIQVTMPHRQPDSIDGNLPPVWYRKNGNLILAIKPGYQLNRKSGSYECIGYPSGSIPRLLLFWLNSEIVRTKKRRIDIGGSYNDFLKELGFSSNTGRGKRGDAKRVALESERLFKSTISFEHVTEESNQWVDMPIAPKGSLWWNLEQPDQGTLFDSWIEIGEEFYNCLSKSPVPLDMRVLSHFKGSPLGLDMAAWVSYRSYLVAMKGKPTKVTWRQMMGQFGSSYKDPRNFQRNASSVITELQALRSGIGVEVVRGGLRIKPSDIQLGQF